jgi:hypothetical protein
MKLFPETRRDYFRIFFVVLLLWAVGIVVAFIPGNWGKNLSSGIGLGNSLISLVAVVLVVGNYYHQERRERDAVMQAHFFQLLSRLPELLPERDLEKLRGHSAFFKRRGGLLVATDEEEHLRRNHADLPRFSRCNKTFAKSQTTRSKEV